MKRFLASLALTLFLAANGLAATWYVRSGVAKPGGSDTTAGGTTTQCTGHGDAAYPGSGTGQNCAYQNLQDALTAAALGDTIILRAAQQFNSGSNQFFGFANKGAGTGTDADYITVTTSGSIPAELSTYPQNYHNGFYTRITTAMAAQMPKVVAVGNQAVFNFANGSHHWKIVGLELTEDGTKNNPALIADSTTTSAPDHIWIDQCFIHPFGEDGTFDRYNVSLAQSGEMAVVLNCQNSKITRNAIQGWAGLKFAGEKQNASPILAIIFNNNLVENNLLEGAGPVFMGGGGDVDPTKLTTGTNWTYTSATLADVTNLQVGDMLAVFSDNLRDNHLTPIFALPSDKYNNPATVQSKFGGRCNAVVQSITPTTGTAGNVTFTHLTAGVTYTGWDLFTFGATSGTFKITFMGQQTTALNYNYTKAELQAALDALSTVDPGDVIVTTQLDDNYAYAPTHLEFTGQYEAPALLNPPTVTSSTLSGGDADVPAGFFSGQQESYVNLQDSANGSLTDKPVNGATVYWEGFQAHDSVFRQNIFAHPIAGHPGPGWPNEIVGVKGFVETKGITNASFIGNVFTGEATGFVLTVRNQGGGTPWANINGMVIRSNFWDRTNFPFPALFSDGAYQSDISHDVTIANNLLMNGAPPDEVEQSASTEHAFFQTQSGFNVTLTHNTYFGGGRILQAYLSAVTQNVIMRDNIFRPWGLWAFCAESTGPTEPDCFTGFTSDHNLVVNNKGLSSGNETNWFNYFGAGVGWVENTLQAVGFTTLSSNTDPDDGQPKTDWGMNPRLATGSRYKAGGDRQASDGGDVGVNFTLLYTDMGFDPLSGQAAGEPPVGVRGKFPIRGRIRVRF